MAAPGPEAEIQLEPIVPDIPLSDFSNHLGDAPEEKDWEKQTLPFRLPILAPSASNEQRSDWSLRLGAITRFPSRLKSPPPRPSIPLRRRFTVIPEYDIPLADILEDRHASPLSLREFEEYLLYVERSVENLYFCLWLKQYNEAYTEWESRLPPDESPSTSTFRRPFQQSRSRSVNVPLAQSFQRARRLFFNSSSQYELNLNEDLIEPVKQWVRPPRRPKPRGTPSPSSSKPKQRKEAWEEDSQPEGEESDESDPAQALSHPHPRELERIKTEVEGTLRQSLTRFLQLSFTNSGRSHDKLGFSVWAVYMIASIAVGVSLIVNHKPRALRLVVTPMVFIGFTVLFAVLNGICPAIFAFGDARQLYPYEIFLIECRFFMRDPNAQTRVDWKGVSGASSGGHSADPILVPKRALPRERYKGLRSLAVKARRTFPAWRKRRRPRRDLEQGRVHTESGFGFRASPEPEPENDLGSLGKASSSPHTTEAPTFPAPAYIPNTTPSVYRLCEQMHKHPWTPTSAAMGGFNIYSLSPHPYQRQSRSTANPSLVFPDEDDFARSLDLDLSDPRALGLYGPMVTIPNPMVRRAQREIFIRAMILSAFTTVPIIVILLVIP